MNFSTSNTKIKLETNSWIPWGSDYDKHNWFIDSECASEHSKDNIKYHRFESPLANYTLRIYKQKSLIPYMFKHRHPIKIRLYVELDIKYLILTKDDLPKTQTIIYENNEAPLILGLCRLLLSKQKLIEIYRDMLTKA